MERSQREFGCACTTELQCVSTGKPAEPCWSQLGRRHSQLSLFAGWLRLITNCPWRTGSLVSTRTRMIQAKVATVAATKTAAEALAKLPVLWRGCALQLVGGSPSRKLRVLTPFNLHYRPEGKAESCSDGSNILEAWLVRQRCACRPSLIVSSSVLVHSLAQWIATATRIGTRMQ